MSNNNKPNYIIILLTCFTIIVTLLTQYPDPSILKFAKPAMNISWFVVFFAVSVNNKNNKISSFLKVFLFGYFILMLEMLFAFLAFNNQFPRIAYILLVPMFSYYIGYNMAPHINENVFRLVLLFYLSVVTVLSFILSRKYVGSFFMWLDSQEYLYEQKNSIGSICGSALIISIFVFQKRKLLLLVLQSFVIVLLFFILLSFQCRSALLGLVISILTYILFQSKHNKYIFCILVILFCFFAYILYSSMFSNTLLQNEVLSKIIFFNRMHMEGMNEFSSGRLGYFSETFHLIADNFFFGQGNYMIDNFYLLTTVETGVVGLIVLLSIWLSRIYLNVTSYLNKSFISNIVFTLIFYYFVLSMLEAYPPFGPGVTTFIFWLLCGYNDFNNFSNHSSLTDKDLDLVNTSLASSTIK